MSKADFSTFDVQVGLLSTDMLNMNTLSAGYNFDLSEGSGSSTENDQTVQHSQVAL